MSGAEWVQPGAAAYVIQPEERASLRAEAVTVDRVLKRDVVLSNGERFNRNTLQQRPGDAWSVSYRLVPADDPQVAEIQAKIRRRQDENRAHAAFDTWRRDRSSANAAAVAAAFGRLA